MQARQSTFVNPSKVAHFNDRPKPNKNISHMHTSGIIAHDAPDPIPPARGNANYKAKGLDGQWMNPNAIDGDTF